MVYIKRIFLLVIGAQMVIEVYHCIFSCLDFILWGTYVLGFLVCFVSVSFITRT